MDAKAAKMTPGSKIYKLFDYKEVLVEGKKESFLITIEKLKAKSRNELEGHGPKA